MSTAAPAQESTTQGEFSRSPDAQSRDPESTIRSVARKESLFIQTMLALQEQAFSPEIEKVFERRWPIGKAAEMVGTSRQMIRLREKEGKLPRPAKVTDNRYADYSLDDINRMRDLFDTRPHRADTDEPTVLSFSTFKGGCGKSTMSVHCAQYLALKGYRVLFIDCDPQGSATTLFGLNPDLPAATIESLDDESDSPLDYTLEEYLARDFTEFANAIQASYFPGIDIVPASMDLSQAEYQLAAVVQSDPQRLNDLRDGIRSVWNDYDVIIMDPPPALGLLSLSVLSAANALVIPMRPTVVDFASTAKFMSMLKSNLASMLRAELPVSYNFESLLVNSVVNKAAHEMITQAMRTMFAEEDLLPVMMMDSAEIDNSSKDMMTVYDLTVPTRGYDTYNRCIAYLDAVFGEIETRIRRTWPSHRKQLRAEAKI